MKTAIRHLDMYVPNDGSINRLMLSKPTLCSSQCTLLSRKVRWLAIDCFIPSIGFEVQLHHSCKWGLKILSKYSASLSLMYLIVLALKILERLDSSSKLGALSRFRPRIKPRTPSWITRPIRRTQGDWSSWWKMGVRFSKFERLWARSTFNLLPTGYLCLPEPQRNRNFNYAGSFVGSSGHPWRIHRFRSLALAR